MKLEKIIEKAEKYKYEACRDKFMRKHFGFGNYDVITPLMLIKAIKKVVDLSLGRKNV